MKLLLILLPALAHARFNIRIDVATRESDVNVNLLGEDDHIIDDAETREFRLTDYSLKSACSQYYGPWPTDVYIHSPTPWSDLYQRYGWAQVHRKLKPVKATILGIHSQPEIIANQRFRNNVTKRVDYKAELSQSVSNTVSNSWNMQHEIKIGQDIEVEFKIPIGSVGGKTSFSYTHQWGKSGSDSQSITLTASAGVTIPVEPEETVEAIMTASRGTMEIEVVYEATVDGDVAVNYEDTWNGHYFWRYDVNAVMASGGLPRTLQVTETLKVGFYADVEIEVRQKNGRRKLMADITF
ncbi:spherulin-2A-like [Leguminivora glycinivorella]|uniref:spherulin-2A-like n=1 Tax=Leguminivora glycinivorella TaxID=1035111 RepID=UPI00200F2E84|nr:spherulin-2A-like [Leguminivora glycinivorella]